MTTLPASLIGYQPVESYRLLCPHCIEPVNLFRDQLQERRITPKVDSSYLEDFYKKIEALCPQCLKSIELSGDIASNISEQRIFKVKPALTGK